MTPKHHTRHRHRATTADTTLLYHGQRARAQVSIIIIYPTIILSIIITINITLRILYNN